MYSRGAILRLCEGRKSQIDCVRHSITPQGHGQACESDGVRVLLEIAQAMHVRHTTCAISRGHMQGTIGTLTIAHKSSHGGRHLRRHKSAQNTTNKLKNGESPKLFEKWNGQTSVGQSREQKKKKHRRSKAHLSDEACEEYCAKGSVGATSKHIVKMWCLGDCKMMKNKHDFSSLARNEK